MRTANAAFTIDTWDQSPLDDASGTQLARAEVAKTFTGDLEATSTAHLLLADAINGTGTRAYSAVERITGVLQGRPGSFVLLHNAFDDGQGGGQATWTILPDSGTEGLSGIHGAAELRNDGEHHSLTLSYDLD